MVVDRSIVDLSHRRRRRSKDEVSMDRMDPSRRVEMMEERRLETQLTELGAPSRLANALESLGATTIRQVLKLSRGDFEKTRSFGEKSIKDLCALLREAGFTPPPSWLRSNREPGG